MSSVIETHSKDETPKTLKIKPVSKKKKKENNIYTTSIITRQVLVGIRNVNKNIEETLKRMIAASIEGKCISEGYIKPDSIKLLTYSCGLVKDSNILFEIVFECTVCCPVEGMYINCVAKNITKAGIRAELSENISPVVIFVARDHNYLSSSFHQLKRMII